MLITQRYSPSLGETDIVNESFRSRKVQPTMSPSKYNWENAFSKTSADSATDSSAIVFLCDTLERGVAITDVDNLGIKKINNSS